MKVLKFGGTSMGSVEGLRAVATIVEQAAARQSTWVVVSAMSGVTSALLTMSHRAAAADKGYLEALEELSARHLETLQALCGKMQPEVEGQLCRLLASLQEWLQGVYLLREASPRSLDLISSFGEQFSALILTAYLRKRGQETTCLDARRLFRTQERFGTVQVDTRRTYSNLRRYYRRYEGLHIVTGYIASDAERVTTTLGRGGSDYTATLIAAALGAEEVEIWTDVNGIMTANPRVVSAAYPLNELSYEEVMEMAYFGAKVMYPQALHPVAEKKIPLRVKNTFAPAFEGTYISAQPAGMRHLIRNLSAISEVSLLEVLGSALVPLIDLEARCLQVLARAHVFVIFLAQHPAAHAMTFVLYKKDVDRAAQALTETLSAELQRKAIRRICYQHGYSLIAAIGKHMLDTPGIAACLFGALAKQGINVKMTAQGTSDSNMAIVVASAQLDEALNTLHQAFFFPERGEISLFLLGVGLIGGELLQQIAQLQVELRQPGRQLVLKGVANSQKMCLQAKGIPFDRAMDMLSTGDSYTLSAFLRGMQDISAAGGVFVDCTSSEEVAAHYAVLVRAGVSVVTPNKRAFSGNMSQYKQLQSVVGYTLRCFYETTVGAGLPVLSTVRDLRVSGDKVLKMEGVLSGTLSYIFNRFNEGGTFSELVQEAQARGLTEPDPREDLKGTDVARKLLIVAREAGYVLNMEDIKLKPYLPAELLAAASLKTFYEGLQAYGATLERRRRAAKRRGQQLCFLATFEPPARAYIALTSIPDSHPCYALSGEDNIVAFTTSRYRERPLMVRGPGAGAAVTAAGVLADIIRASDIAATQHYFFHNTLHSLQLFP